MIKSILLIPVCFALTTAAQTEVFKMKILDTARYTIIQNNIAEPVYLSSDELSKSETILKQAINEQKVFAKTDFSKYRIQLVPSINAKGEKEIWINFFCYNDRRHEWRTKIFPRELVDDGGSCFFDLKVNLTLNNYSAFGMNGYG